MRCFPIGGKIRYFSSMENDVVLESIVIAYGINDHLIYTQNDILNRIDPDESYFLLDDNWTDVAVREVRSFCLLIPYIASQDSVRDYPSKAAVQGWSPFRRGERLTLIALQSERGVPHLECSVRKRVTLKDGYYANHAVVVLDVDSTSLTMVDQRQHRRIKTLIPAQLSTTEGGAVEQALIVDFSEYYAKLEFDMTSMLGDVIRDSKTLFLKVPLEDMGRDFELKGKVRRSGDGFVVIEFTGLRKGREYMPLDMLDILELKACLLQHPETQ